MIPSSRHHSVTLPEIQTIADGQVAPRTSENLNLEPGIEKRKGEKEVLKSSSKPLKEKTTKAERRAMQEVQRAAKASCKAEGSKAVAESGRAAAGKSTKQPSRKKVEPSCAFPVAAVKRAGDLLSEIDRKNDVPPPRVQFDDKSRMEKARRHAVVNPTDRNRVELFQHLPQYEHGTKLSNLESKFFHLGLVHPSVFESILRYTTGDISGSNARCIAMLRALQDAVRDYCTSHEKVLVRDLTTKINYYVSFFTECRPLSMSMGNAIRFVKSRIAHLSLNYSEFEAKTSLCSDIDRFINEKIILADKVIVRHAFTKVRDGDVLLTYGVSCVVEMILLYAHELGKKFRVVVVDSHPRLEGQALLRRLVAKGLSCTYTHINAISYIMHEVTRVLLGASAVLSNGTVYSRVGTSCVAMVAHAFRVPKLSVDKLQLLAGDPDAIARVPGRMDVNYLDNWASEDNLRLLNLTYDATPSDYVSVIVTDYGMVNYFMNTAKF
ncbi:unnamed protein product [Sphenostylis stenocarpa]|uniref:Translation initiation factor eIF2B subunit delta n=1 Tax=Sphenostylis stenocarpa TaxID=92480 RepID=A0AA86SE67_9FABA|nr:unnamed protein product [Sphenostylis stenocarpa]